MSAGSAGDGSLCRNGIVNYGSASRTARSAISAGSARFGGNAAFRLVTEGNNFGVLPFDSVSARRAVQAAGSEVKSSIDFDCKNRDARTLVIRSPTDFQRSGVFQAQFVRRNDIVEVTGQSRNGAISGTEHDGVTGLWCEFRLRQQSDKVAVECKGIAKEAESWHNIFALTTGWSTPKFQDFARFFKATNLGL